MNTRFKLKVIAAVAAAAVITLPGLARADAIAQSILDISSFKFMIGNDAAGGGTSLVGSGISITSANTVDSFAKLNGGIDNGSPIPGLLSGEVGSKSCVGAGCPGVYVAGTKLLQSSAAPFATYTGSTGVVTGNAISGSAHALTDNTVSLKPTGDGSTQSNVNLNATFTIVVGTAGNRLQTSFDATQFLRANISDPGLASAGDSWVMTLTGPGTAFVWVPTGAAPGAITGGKSFAEAFSLTNTVTDLTPGLMNDPLEINQSVSAGGYGFEAETGVLGMGTYTLSIRHTGTADASLVPEPGSLAMLGTGLLVAALSTRRRKPKA